MMIGTGRSICATLQLFLAKTSNILHFSLHIGTAFPKLFNIMQSIGERLEEARKRKGISIREAAESTKIRSDYLHKFESNQYDLRLPEIYVCGFLRSYAAFLKLPADKIIADYNALNSSPEPKLGARTVNREVYGRMDISTTKEPKAHDGDPIVRTGSSTPPMPAAAATESATTTTAAAAPRSPVAFIPPAHSTGSPIDRKLLIKIGALIVVVVIILILIISLVFTHNSSSGLSNTATAPYAARANQEILISPQPGENTFDIAAKNGSVWARASATIGSTIYFQGTLQPGEKRTLPRRGEVHIECDRPENLWLTVGQWTGQLADPKTGALMTSGTILKP